MTTTARASTPYGPLVSKEDIPLPWISCLWCDYRDKIEFDLAQHMNEKHRGNKDSIDDGLMQIPIDPKDRKTTKALSGDFFARFESAIEFRLDVAVEMAKEENRDKGVKHAIKQIQRRILARQQEADKARIVSASRTI